MIYSIIVTFNPDPDSLFKLVNTLIDSQVVPVIVDNCSSTPISMPCKVIRLKENFGIAKAQNTGISFVSNSNAHTVIFFDQDSCIVDKQFINRLYEPIANKRSKITAPVFIDNACGFIYPIVDINKWGVRTKYRPDEESSEFTVNNVISSGTMVDLKVLNKVGGMIDSLFIDYVDTEWCLRANSKGFNILVVPKARMIHSIGDKVIRIGKFNIPKHSPFRRYYRIRNSFFLLRLPYVPKIMAIREILFSIIHQFILIVYSSNERLEYTKSLFRGLKDGVLGRFS